MSPDLGNFVRNLQMALRLPDAAFLETVDRQKVKLSADLCGPERIEMLLLATKIANLFVVKHDYRRRRIRVAGRPLGFMLDPANGCNLGCASCANTSNKDFAARVLNAWPAGVMKGNTYSRIIDDNGPWAWVGHFYNNSEPYLNKNTHAFIKRAAQFRVRTSTSSNMSIPKLDVDAIVASGLDELQIAIDGVTQKVYEKYRRGGDVSLVFENVRRLVEAKRARNSSTPFIRWHYLTFQHNVHELDAGMAKARELGIDMFFVVTPIDVAADDPTVIAEAHPRAWECTHLTPIQPAVMNTDISPVAEDIERAFTERYAERYVADDAAANGTANHCDWLYMATIFDAYGRVFPCCIGDTKGHARFQFGSVNGNNEAVLNSREYLAARSFVHGIPKADGMPQVRCETCNGRPTPQVGLGAVRDTLNKMAHAQPWLTPDLLDIMAGWSEHRT